MLASSRRSPWARSLNFGSAPDGSARIELKNFKRKRLHQRRTGVCGRLERTGLADSALQLFNTLGGLIEPLAPADGHTLRMYACGPTVYDYGHIGNFRTFLHVDVLRRTLKQNGVAVRHAMNITDVDDKIIRNAAAAGTDIGAYTRKYEDAFFEDMDALGVERPEVLPRATENIEEMVKLIEELAAKDIAYQVEDGSWYFRIARFADYGKLSKKDFAGIEDGARVDVDEYEKDAARDFALDADAPVGTSNAPPWQPSSWARASICTPAGRTSCSRTMKTRLPSRSRPAGTSLRGTGCMCASCWWKGARCPSRRAISIRSATSCSRGTAPPPSASSSSVFPTGTS
jgi:hypothetical protein